MTKGEKAVVERALTWLEDTEKPVHVRLAMVVVELELLVNTNPPRRRQKPHGGPGVETP